MNKDEEVLNSIVTNIMNDTNSKLTVLFDIVKERIQKRFDIHQSDVNFYSNMRVSYPQFEQGYRRTDYYYVLGPEDNIHVLSVEFKTGSVVQDDGTFSIDSTLHYKVLI